MSCEIKDNSVLSVEFSGEEEEPVSLGDAKLWCKIDEDTEMDNTLIEELIKSARSICEQFVNQSLVNRSVVAILNNSLGGSWLPFGPVLNITSVKNEDDEVLEDQTDYNIRFDGFKQLDTPKSSYVKIEYTAGYESLPKIYKTAILNQVAWMYENRGDESKASMLSGTAKLLLRPFKRA